MKTRAKPIASSGARDSRKSRLSPRRDVRPLPVRGWALALSAALVVGSVHPVLADGRHRQHGAHAHPPVHAHATRGHRPAHRHHRHGHDWAPAAAALLGLAVLSLAVPPPKAVYHRHPRPVGGWVPRYRRIIHTVPQARQHYQFNVPAQAVRTRGPVPLPRPCLMIREYQTQVVVGGRAAEAYGDACLQADGSWRLGPPKLALR